MSKTYTGIIPPLVTPLKKDGSLDASGVHRLVEHCIQGGVTGVFCNGTSGEAMRLEDSIWEQNTRQVLDAVDGRVDVFCGAIDASASRAIEKIKKIEDMGGKLAVCTAPFYLSSFGQDEILRHFDKVCASTSIDIAIYNIPESTHVNILPETVARLADHPRIVACKDSSADWQHLQRILFLCRDKNISILNGAEELCSAAMLYGADGCIPGLANYIPEVFVELYRACKAGNIPESFRLQHRIYNIRKCLFLNGCWMSGMKCLNKIFGIGEDGISSGLVNYSAAQEQEAARILQAEGILV